MEDEEEEFRAGRTRFRTARGYWQMRIPGLCTNEHRLLLLDRTRAAASDQRDMLSARRGRLSGPFRNG